MKAVGFLLLAAVVGVKSLVCPDGQLACGVVGCYDPNIQGCNDNNGGIQCLNSCNGVCYWNNQFCYNNVTICYNDQLICDLQYYTDTDGFVSRPTCYNPSASNCYNNTLCEKYLICGTRCLNLFSEVCVNNQTVCQSDDAYWYNTVARDSFDICGPQQQCYEKTQSVCVGDNDTICPIGNEACSGVCYNPGLQICVNGIVQCLNSCNGACYWNNQFCYNNVTICYNDQLICDLQYYTDTDGFVSRPTCYNPSASNCYNNTLCEKYLICGTRCLNLFSEVCVNNQTVCQSDDAYWYNTDARDSFDICGPQQQCYEKTQSVCVGDNDTICPIGNEACSGVCYNPGLQICVNGIVQCLNSCNGACYWNNQFCYNNVTICYNDQLICDLQYYTDTDGFVSRPTCYNPSASNCYNNTLCEKYLICGTRCLNLFSEVCVNNQTVCQSDDAYWYNTDARDSFDICGPQQQCYEKTQSVCVGDNDTICPIGNEACFGVCYNPQLQYCARGNNTIYCINNPSDKICLTTTTQIISISESSNTTVMTTTTTTTTTTTMGGCCAIQNCTTDSDCCQSASLECQCYRHIQTDVYGSCVNPYTVPVCGDGCPVQVKCKFDSDCCKCQCAQVTFTGADGESVTRKQCVRR